ncbi:hypothetical protein SAY86_002301 [Trapa natans]|uniref:Uncharacterized protein n=1 Tax=Trapa natans TaxID=22666 RepID=A0AAN7R093_TRANT|nr:hypothetical protein SAY86_002301 [Trapa natans]
MDFLSREWCSFALHQAYHPGLVRDDRSIVLLDPPPPIKRLGSEHGSPTHFTMEKSVKIDSTADFSPLPPWKTNDVKVSILQLVLEIRGEICIHRHEQRCKGKWSITSPLISRVEIWDILIDEASSKTASLTGVMVGLHAELYKDPDMDGEEDIAGTCYLLVLWTNSGTVKIDMSDDFKLYRTWATAINQMLMVSSASPSLSHSKIHNPPFHQR